MKINKMDVYIRIIETVPCWFINQEGGHEEALLALTESDARVLQADLSEFDENQTKYRYGYFIGFDPSMWEKMKSEVESLGGDISILVFG